MENSKAILWQRVQGTGLERFELNRITDGWALRGTILALDEHGPAQADYEIFCDTGWRTRRVNVRVREGGEERSLRLAVEDGRWYADDTEQEAVRGCIDVDLSWSPSTNTLPIRRLGLQVGENSGPITAAWVRFPALTIEPLPQEYERLAERRFRYSSRRGAFTAELEVDDDDLVIDYEGIWRRVRG
ncbi:MAG TPA: putative glycolipid-binding domain-containing protein [Thermoanaerobaculia bacterium]